MVLWACAAAADGLAGGTSTGTSSGRAAPALSPRVGAAYDGWKVSHYELQGVSGTLEDKLEKGLALTGESKLLRTKRPAFHAAQLDEDVRRCRLYLARNGYPDAVVDAHVEANPAGRSLRIFIQVQTGPAVRVDAVALEGAPPQLERNARRAVAMREGAVFTQEALQQSTAAIETVLKNAGYALPTVRSSVDALDSFRVRVNFQIEPSARYVFGEVRVSGIGADLVPLAERTTGIDPGDRFSPEELVRAQDSLRLLELFRQIRLSTPQIDSSTLALQADLVEREPRTLEGRVGYWSEDRLRAAASWEHRNLLSGGRGVKFEGEYSQYRQRAAASTWWPALLGTRTRETLTLSGENELEDSYSQLTTGLELSTLYRRSLRTTYRLAVAVAYVDYLDKTVDQELSSGQGWLTLLTGNINLDRTDDRLDPKRGHLVWANGEWSPPIVSLNRFVRVQAGGTVFVPLPLRSVLASRLQGGMAHALSGTEELLPGKRFYEGGVNSHRGFHRRELGPLDAEGNPVGGEVELLAGAELRLPILGRLMGAAFCDVGQVWETRGDVGLDNLEPAAGGGLMLATPVGPLSAYVGTRLRTPPAGQDRTVWHFTIGYAF